MKKPLPCDTCSWYLGAETTEVPNSGLEYVRCANPAFILGDRGYWITMKTDCHVALKAPDHVRAWRDAVEV